jgi:hypothetical protein
MDIVDRLRAAAREFNKTEVHSAIWGAIAEIEDLRSRIRPPSKMAVDCISIELFTITPSDRVLYLRKYADKEMIRRANHSGFNLLAEQARLAALEFERGWRE